MSAIFGVLKKHNHPIEPERLTKLRQTMAHRNTDGEGFWQTECSALGFFKLVVQPQNTNEQLPLETDDYVLTADVRLDNRDELYNLLGLNKKQWQHKADSYLLLQAYQEWGDKCVSRLEGEFVFAVWNKISRKLFIATDPIGFRPLFYYDGPNEFIFCSEIKGVVAAKTTPNYFNEEHLVEYHFRKSAPSQTYNKEVFALCGGNTLIVENHEVSIKKYWTLETKDKYSFVHDDEWISCLRHLMYKAVEKRLTQDTPVGVNLSGGLDSSSIACILSELLAKKNKPLYAFSSVLPVNHTGIELDERKYIEIVNKHCPNIIQTFVEAPGIGPFDNIKEAFERDEAIPNGFFYMDQALLKAAREKEVRSVFTGFGGDFLVSWGGRYVIYLLIQQGKYKMAIQLLRQLSKNYNNSLLKQFTKDYLVYTSLWKKASKLKPQKENWQRTSVLQPGFVGGYKHLQRFDLVSDQRIEIKKNVELGRIGRLIGTFVNRDAYYNVAASIPWFDKDLLEFLIEVPVHLFIKDGWRRNLIRHAMEGVLPPEIQLRRDKLPYNADFARRALNGREKLYEMMDSTKYSFVFDKYLDRQVIIDHFDSIKPHAGFSGPTSAMSIRITQAGIACKILGHLKDINYNFDEVSSF